MSLGRAEPGSAAAAAAGQEEAGQAGGAGGVVEECERAAVPASMLAGVFSHEALASVWDQEHHREGAGASETPRWGEVSLEGILEEAGDAGGAGGERREGGGGGGEERVLDEIARFRLEMEERVKTETRALAVHLDTVRAQLTDAEADRSRAHKQAALLKEQLRESLAQVARAQHTHNLEYVKNITVKYLEQPQPDESLLRALGSALQISPAEMARVQRAQARGLFGALFR